MISPLGRDLTLGGFILPIRAALTGVVAGRRSDAVILSAACGALDALALRKGDGTSIGGGEVLR